MTSECPQCGNDTKTAEFDLTEGRTAVVEQCRCGFWETADIIYSYSRAQAIEDGVLVDLTEWASAKTGFIGGFTIPVAVTAAVWADIEAIPPSMKGLQDVRGRAHDLLWMASLAARRAAEPQIDFQVRMRIGRTQTQVYTMTIGPGDDGEPVITIMKPGED